MIETTELKLVRGVQVDALLGERAFLDQWQRLHAACPWATGYQSSAFVSTWYRVHRSAFDPLLVLWFDREGQLQGLMPLAVTEHDSAIVSAGDRQAEYQGWICAPDLVDSFPPAAFAAMLARFPSKQLTFRYLPPGIPLSWTERPQADELCTMHTHRRPLMSLGDGTAIEASLKKSGNKNRLRQLKKIGAVEFKRVEDPTEFDALLAEIVLHHDARCLAAYGFAPFQRDAFKRDFTRALMNESGLIHFTTLTAGGQLLSAHVNLIKGRELQLGLIAHNPAFEDVSPGKLHVLFLARMLVQAGFEQIDLTPGGEAYKERFATGGDSVNELIIYPSHARRAWGVARHAVEEAAKRTLRAINVNPVLLRSIAGR